MNNKIKFAAWSGVVVIAIYFISSFFNALLGFTVGSYITIILNSIFGFIFMYGFFVLAKKYKQGMLKGFSVYFMVLTVILMIVGFVSAPYSQGMVSEFQNMETQLKSLEEQYGGADQIPDEEMEKIYPSEEFLFEMLMWFLVAYVLSFLFYGIPLIFFGIGLMKLGDKVELSKAAGIMNIVGGAATIILVGWILIFIAFILEIIILFKESKKIKQR